LVDEVAAESRLSLMDTPHGYLQVRRLQMLTVVWMSIEVAVSIYAAVRAHSIALIGFGGDSVIELASATAVLARFASGGRFISERQASKTMAWLLFALAAFIATASIYSLFGDLKPQTSYLGMLLLFAAAVVMPWLAAQKRRLACGNSKFLATRRCHSEFGLRISGLDRSRRARTQRRLWTLVDRFSRRPRAIAHRHQRGNRSSPRRSLLLQLDKLHEGRP